MKKVRAFVVLSFVLLAGLVLVPVSAEASSLAVDGHCVVNGDGQVSLVAKASSYTYGGYAPLKWVYRARSLADSQEDQGWYTDLGFRETLTVETGGSNFETRFRSLFVPTEGMVYRLDLLTNIHGRSFDRYNRVAFYNDETTTDCRKVE